MERSTLLKELKNLIIQNEYVDELVDEVVDFIDTMLSDIEDAFIEIRGELDLAMEDFGCLQECVVAARDKASDWADKLY